MGKTETLKRLKVLLADLYDTRYGGHLAARLYKAQGLADGYMQALRDCEVVDDAELLAFVTAEQKRALERAVKVVSK